MDYGTGIFQITDPESKSTWVESTWDHTRIRIFKQTSQTVQILQFCASLIVNLVVLFAARYFRFYK